MRKWIGDKLNLDAALRLDVGYRNRRRVKKLLEEDGITIRRCVAENYEGRRQWLPFKRLVVHVARCDADQAEELLRLNGYKLLYHF